MVFLIALFMSAPDGLSASVCHTIPFLISLVRQFMSRAASARGQAGFSRAELISNYGAEYPIPDDPASLPAMISSPATSSQPSNSPAVLAYWIN